MGAAVQTTDLPLNTAPLGIFVEIVFGTGVNVAVQATLAVSVKEPLEQLVPLQFAKTEPAAGRAVRVMFVPAIKTAEQLLPQSIPAGELVTVPAPLPDLKTVRANCWAAPFNTVTAIVWSAVELSLYRARTIN